MNIWTQDLLKLKAFRIAIVVGVIIYAGIYFSDYNSPEKKCEREADKVVSMLRLNLASEMQTLQLKAAKRQMIQKCLRDNRG